MRPSDEQLKRLGATLREIDPATLQSDPDEGKVRWFLGDNGTEIFVWARPSEPPHHIQLVFARVSVEWSRKVGLLTGTFNSTGATMGGRYDPYLLQLGITADPEVCRSALLLLKETTIDPHAIGPLLDALENALAKLTERG